MLKPDRETIERAMGDPMRMMPSERARLEKLGYVARPLDPALLAEYVAKEQAMWSAYLDREIAQARRIRTMFAQHKDTDDGKEKDHVRDRPPTA